MNLGVQVCGLIICGNDSISSCGKQLDNNIKFRTTFKQFQITTTVPKRKTNLLHLPISFQVDYTPLQPEDFSLESVALENFDILSLSLKNTETNLMSFGIYSRNFSSDGNAPTILEPSKFIFK